MKKTTGQRKRGIRLLSWNIQWGRGADGRVDLERTRDTIRAAGPLDVICLQEVASNFPGLAGGAREDEPAFFAAAFADRKSTRLNSSHSDRSRMPSSA